MNIPGRFNGPRASGNGGYTCGVIARLLAGDVEVTLRSPPPLDTVMQAHATDDGVEVFDGQTLVATARHDAFDPPAVPTTPTWDDAVTAASRYQGHIRHEFPTCFTCGPRRTDGLGIFAGPVDGTGVVAAPWRPNPSLRGADWFVTDPIVWAALDCPGAWAQARDLTDYPVVLGRMVAKITAPVKIDEPHVLTAWRLGEEGRKSYAATALLDANGATIATARQTWITVSGG